MIKIAGYNKGYRIVSLAKSDTVKNDLLRQNVDSLCLYDNEIVIFPDNEIVSSDDKLIEELKKFNEYDVFEIYNNGKLSRCFDHSSEENIFFITEKCNSCCLMCPSSDYSRKNGSISSIDNLIEIARHIPSYVGHITITGGEPFMAGKEVFRLLQFCRVKFVNTEFQILTNGRVFAIKEYVDNLVASIPEYTIIGIPIHGSNEMVHDTITSVKGSFRQTITGLKQLLDNDIRIELRIVVSKLNVEDLGAIARYIVSNLSGVDHVTIMGMEMTGNAAVNADIVWIDYRDSFPYIKNAIDMLMGAGIDVRLYNYPLCVVEEKYRMLCSCSISSWKIKYAENCDKCRLKCICGGVFASTFRFENGELEAVI